MPLFPPLLPQDPPAADPSPVSSASAPSQSTEETPEVDQTRFGDWEKNGRCIDF